jgi:hypothetical protein
MVKAVDSLGLEIPDDVSTVISADLGEELGNGAFGLVYLPEDDGKL